MDSGAVEKINLSNTGAVIFLNASVNTAGLGITKGAISITDSGAVEKINLSNSGKVTLPNASIASGGDITTSRVIATKVGVNVKATNNVNQIILATTGIVNCSDTIGLSNTRTIRLPESKS